MCDPFQTMHEQYRTEVAGPWQTRKCYPWEYEAKVQELIQMADKMPTSYTTEQTWCREQAKILQNRATYIRQRWAEKQAKEEARKQASELFRQQLAEINANMQAILQSTQQVIQQATQQSTPPAPQKEEDKETRPQPLYQATAEDAEDDAESIEEKQTEHQHGSSKLSSDKPDSKITLPTFPRLCTKPSSEDSAACLTNALAVHQHAMLLAWHGFLHGYMDYAEGMEATGQG